MSHTDEPDPSQPELLTVQEAATFLGVSRWTMYRWLRSEEDIPVLLIGGDARIPRRALQAWVDRRTSDSGQGLIGSNRRRRR